MNKFLIICFMIITIFLPACNKIEHAEKVLSASQAPQVVLRVTNWGPQTAKVGTTPNKQPDGSIGLWIEVSGTQGLGEAQVLFSGQPAKLTIVQEKLITAAIETNLISEGEKEVSIKQNSTGKIFPVGTFRISAE